MNRADSVDDEIDEVIVRPSVGNAWLSGGLRYRYVIRPIPADLHTPRAQVGTQSVMSVRVIVGHGQPSGRIVNS